MRKILQAAICAIALAGPATAAQRADIQEIPVPDWFGRIVEQHVREMARLKYYDRITEERAYRELKPVTDFFHGHLLTKGMGTYTNEDGFLRSTALVLYHTQETTGKWASQAPTPLSERTPRSVVGRLDGTTVPAIEITGIEGLRSIGIYEQVGTVFAGDIARAMGGLDDGGEWRGYPTIGRGTAQCRPSYQFYVWPRKEGRYTSAGRRFEVVLECVKPSKTDVPSILLRPDGEGKNPFQR